MDGWMDGWIWMDMHEVNLFLRVCYEITFKSVGSKQLNKHPLIKIHRMKRCISCSYRTSV